MLNVLAIGDLHLSGKNPPERKDDLTTKQWEKLDYIIEISNYHNCPCICTGDIFDSALVSRKIMSTFGERINKLKNPFYFVFGNHDLQYHSMDMIEQTSLGVLWLNNKMLKHISEFEGDYGRAWSYIDFKNPFHDPDAQYLLSHRAIVNDNLISANSWILDDQNFCQHVKELTRYELIICGHWHKSYEFFYQYAPDKDVHVLNPGVVCRRTIDERERPAIYFLDLDACYDNKQEEHATSIDLNALDSDLVLREESIKSGIAPHKDEITQFVQQLKSQQLSKKVSFIDSLIVAVEQVGQKSIEKEMRDIIATVQAKKKGAAI
jgi:DNA repair exonuclease SbcCD nuclease subunit